MSGFVEKNGTLYAEGVSFAEIARAAGTPCYVYSAGSIRDQYARLDQAMRRALPRQPLLCYAAKANGNLAVLALLNKAGSGLEVVSEGELLRGLKAGFPPERIVATGVGKTKAEIARYLTAGIHQINVESLPELELVDTIAGELGKKADIVFRLNPDIGGGGHKKITTGGKDNKFGIDQEAVFAGFARAHEMKHVRALGLSVHIGSQVFEVKTFEKVFAKFPALVKALRAEGYNISRLDIGGGFPIQYKDESLLDLDAYARWVRDIIAPLETEIIMEPGRYLVGNAGVLLSEVLYVKETPGRTFLVLDAGMNDLLRPALYNAWHGIEPVSNRNAPKKNYDVVGPVCESSDHFTTEEERGRVMPEMRAGDLAVIRSAGAYGFVMASNYNTRPLPAEVLVDGARFAIIRPRQNLDALIAQETIPDWLS